MNIYNFALIYLALISVVSIIMTIYDKYAAKHNPHGRIPEATLLFMSAIGGSVAMLATMLLIRHKTLHLKFMLGIPLIIILQFAAIYLVKIYLL